MAFGILIHSAPGKGAKPITEMSRDQMVVEKHEVKPGCCHTLQIKPLIWTSSDPDFVTLPRQLSRKGHKSQLWLKDTKLKELNAPK